MGCVNESLRDRHRMVCVVSLQALEEEAKKAEAEREAEGGDDDHDNRKLKKADRMRYVCMCM